MKKKFQILILLCFAIFFNLSAQDEDCATQLKDAQDLYEQGLIEKIPAKLDKCLKGDNFTHQEKIDAYKLIIMCYIFDDDYEQADKIMEELLRHEPELTVNPNVDAIEFINLFETYRSIPVFSYGVEVGVNKSMVSIQDEFGVYNIKNDRPEDDVVDSLADNSKYNRNNPYKGGIAFSGGVKTRLLLFKQLHLNAGLHFTVRSFEKFYHMYDYTGVDYEETQLTFQMPVSLSYHMKYIGRFSPFVHAGLTPTLLFKSEANIQRNFDPIYSEASASGQTEDLFDLFGSNDEVNGDPDAPSRSFRRALNLNATFGLGLNYKVKRGNFFTELTYSHSFYNQQNAKNRYSFNEGSIIYYYYYVDDNFFLDNVMFTVGYTRSLYKPKKKKIHLKESTQSDKKGGNEDEK